jgi:RNA polymerase sigma-70 factor (sigma-E family)
VAFVEGATPALRRVAHLLVADRGHADDLLQEALVRTYLAWGRVRPGEETAYVRRVMTNLSVDRWRRRRPEVLGGVPERPATHDAHQQVEHRGEAVRALAALSARERAVVVLRYYADLSEQQVAEELGVSVGTVKSTASRALARVRVTAREGLA